MTGLTNEQVQERIAEGKVNVNENPNTRTSNAIFKKLKNVSVFSKMICL